MADSDLPGPARQSAIRHPQTRAWAAREWLYARFCCIRRLMHIRFGGLTTKKSAKMSHTSHAVCNSCLMQQSLAGAVAGNSFAPLGR